MQPREQNVVDRWRESASYWEKHREMIRQMFAPVTQALVDDARITSGLTVLDVATGPGEPALSIAALVSPEGAVVGVDPVQGMIDAARREATRLEIRNARFDVASADHLPFSADAFDAVISRFGVMFFPSPADGIREMLRVLKPGGRLAMAVWHTAESNPFFCLSRIVAQYVDSPPPAPDAPDAFRFASPGKLRDVFVEAGIHDPSERLFRFAIEAPVSLEDFWTLRCEISENLREAVAALSPEQATEAKRQGIEALRPFSTGEGMSFPAEVLIVRATRK